MIPAINSCSGNNNIMNNSSKNIMFCAKNKKQEDDSYIKSDVKVKVRFLKDTLSGDIDDMPFKLTHHNLLNNVFGTFGLIYSKNSKNVTGQINDKDVDLNYKRRFLRKDTLKGTVGDSDVDLKISKTPLWNNYKIKGTYDGQDVNIRIRQNALGFKIKSENSDLQIRGKYLIGNDLSVKGKYDDNKEMLPLIIDIVNDARHARLHA